MVYLNCLLKTRNIQDDFARLLLNNTIKKVGIKWSWFILKSYPRIFFTGLNKTTISIRLDNKTVYEFWTILLQSWRTPQLLLNEEVRLRIKNGFLLLIKYIYLQEILV